MGQLPASAKTTIIVSTIILFIAWITVALRFWVRWITKAGLAGDDWWCLAGICLAFITGTIYLYGVVSDPFGGANMDRDSPTFDYAPRVTYMKASYSIAILYFSLISAVKISVVLFYRRIFAVHFFRFQALVLGGIVTLWWLAGTISTAVYCIPLHQYWTGPSAGGYCWNYNVFWMAMGATEVVIDTAILLLPVKMVWQLQLTLQTKMFVLGIFLLGGFVVVTGIARTIYGYAHNSTNVDYEHGELWSCIHVGTAIICACLPTLRPLYVIGTRMIHSARQSYSCGTSKWAAVMQHAHRGTYHRRSPSDDMHSGPRMVHGFSGQLKHLDSNSHTLSNTRSGSGHLSREDYLIKPSTEHIVIEERVDVEWSRVAANGGSDESVGLTALPKVYLAK